jgi:hypothetical protein
MDELKDRLKMVICPSLTRLPTTHKGLEAVHPTQGADEQNYIHGSIIMSMKGMGCPIFLSPCHVLSTFGLMFFVC